MCNICENNGYVLNYITVQLTPYDKDYRWYKDPCECERGQRWKENDYNVAYNMASRIDKFLDKYKGKVYSKYSSERAGAQELIKDYIENGRRTFEENGGKYE